MDKLSRTFECFMIEKCKISWLLFADDSVLLAYSESGIQQAFNGFIAACGITGIKIITSKTVVLPVHLWKNSVQCLCKLAVFIKVKGEFKYLGVAFMNDGKQDKKLDDRSGKASAVM